MLKLAVDDCRRTGGVGGRITALHGGDEVGKGELSLAMHDGISASLPQAELGEGRRVRPAEDNGAREAASP